VRAGLAADPYAVFRDNLHPAALHARRHWLGEGGRTFARLVRDQARRRAALLDRAGTPLADRIAGLWALWLLDALDHPAAGRALDWLMDRAIPFAQRQSPRRASDEDLFHHLDADEPLVAASLAETPFQPTERVLLKTCAALFFAGAMGRSKDADLRRAASVLAQRLNAGKWSCGVLCDVLLAASTVSNPEAKTVAGLAAARLAAQQRPDGAWPRPLPLGVAAWALGRLGSRVAHRSLQRAVPALIVRQQRDGAFGLARRETQTWFAVAALKAAGALP